MFSYNTIFASDQPNQLELTDPLTEKAWPQFMLHDSVANKNWSKLYEYFPEHQFILKDKENDEIVAIANSIPLSYNEDFEKFTQAGWDWILQKGVDDFNNNITPNIMSALAIVITPNYLGKGISSLVLQEMRKIGMNKNFSHLIAPVRPNLKTLYPIIPIEEYINWKNADGKQFDAWLRVHESIGGKVIKVCHEAMRISGTIDEWEEWAGLKFPESGIYTVKGALIPIKIDKGINQGLYIEPNVLVVHDLLKNS